MDKEYLGDAVYIEYKDGFVILTTENGIESQTIFLEHEVVDGLLNSLIKRYQYNIQVLQYKEE